MERLIQRGEASRVDWEKFNLSTNEIVVLTARINTIHYLFHTTPSITDIAMKSLDKTLALHIRDACKTGISNHATHGKLRYNKRVTIKYL